MTVINHLFWDPIDEGEDDFIIFAIDPGGTTGWATAFIEHGVFNRYTWSCGQIRSLGPGVASVQHGEQQAVHALMQNIEEFVDDYRTHIVVEDFIVQNGTMDRSLLSPVRLTAALFDRLHSSDREYSFYLQSPSNAKNTFSDDYLKRKIMYPKGKQHARDAIRHLLLALRRYNSK